MHRHTDAATLADALDHLRAAPRGAGTVDLIVRRPTTGEREVLAEGVLDPRVGLVGDNWLDRGSRHTQDGSAHPLMQLNVTGARVMHLLAPTPDLRSLAGDQLHLDLDLSVTHLPTGSRLGLGDAVIEVTERPHTGCIKFRDRFGADAWRFVNSPEVRDLRLRGLCAVVVHGGAVRTGDAVVVLSGGE